MKTVQRCWVTAKSVFQIRKLFFFCGLKKILCSQMWVLFTQMSVFTLTLDSQKICVHTFFLWVLKALESKNLQRTHCMALRKGGQAYPKRQVISQFFRWDWYSIVREKNRFVTKETLLYIWMFVYQILVRENESSSIWVCLYHQVF